MGDKKIARRPARRGKAGKSPAFTPERGLQPIALHLSLSKPAINFATGRRPRRRSVAALLTRGARKPRKCCRPG